jgi:molecular chaperone GrpE
MDEAADAANAEARAQDAAARRSGEPAAADAAAGTTADAGGDATAGARPGAPAEALDADAIARELEEQKDKYLRLFAEFDNFRRRSVRDRQEAEHRGMGNLLRGILEILDDLGRFAHVDPASTDAATVVEGVAMVEKKLMKSLAGHGLQLVDPKDHPFDPALHEAITTTPAASADEDHLVAQVYQVGYVFNGTLLRPARVVVRQWNG